MTRISDVRKTTKFKRSIKAISPVIATLLMIAIAVVASLVVYAWVTGYIGGTTSTAGKAIAIPSFALADDGLHVYVQNVGQGTVEVGAIYVNNDQQTFTADPDKVVQAGNTIDLTVGGSYKVNDKLDIKVTTTDGTFMTTTGTVKSTSTPSPTIPPVLYAVNFVLGTGGATISPTAGSHNVGGATLISATAASGNHFTSWTSTGSITFADATVASTTATVNGVGSITANFAADTVQYTLTVTFAGTGTGKVNDGTIDHTATYQNTYTSGSIVALTPTADASSTFTSWSGDGSGTPVRSITVDGNKAVTVTFTIKSTSNLIAIPGFETDSTWVTSVSNLASSRADRHSNNNVRSGNYDGRTDSTSPTNNGLAAAILTETLTATPLTSLPNSNSLTVYLRNRGTADGAYTVEIRIYSGTTMLSYIWCTTAQLPADTSTLKYIRVGDVSAISTTGYTSLVSNLLSDWASKGLLTSLQIDRIQLVSNGNHVSGNDYGQDIVWDDLQLLYYP